MSIEMYRGYVIEGLANPAGDGKYESRGFVRNGHQPGPYFSAESADLGSYATSQGAQDHAILWARQYVDVLIASIGQ